jgi:hypothetical protein
MQEKLEGAIAVGAIAYDAMSPAVKRLLVTETRKTHENTIA